MIWKHNFWWSMEDFLYGIPQGLGFILIFTNHITIVFGFRTFQEAVEMVHCGSIPTTINGRVVPLPLRLEFVLASLCCQNLAVYEPFDCQFYNVLTQDQKSCLATPSYQKKKEKRLSESLVDPASVSVLGIMKDQIWTQKRWVVPPVWKPRRQEFRRVE